MKDLFEIHAPGIDTAALVQELEERVHSRGYSAAELERIRNLSFTPVSPAGPGGFDPALTAELFERPVPPPDFKSRKFRYLKGPLRWLAVRIYKLLAQVHARLSENKTKAFYSVVHEFIAVNHRHEKLRANFDLVLLENLRLRAKLQEALDARLGNLSAENAQTDLESPVALPERPPEQARAESALLDALPETPGGTVCILDDGGAQLALELRGRGRKKIIVNAPDGIRFRLARQAGDAEVFPGNADHCLAEQMDASLAAVIIPDLGQLSGHAPLLPRLIRRKLAPGGHLLMRLSEAMQTSAFARTPPYSVDTEALLAEFQDGGLEVIQHAVAGAGAFAVVLRAGTESGMGTDSEEGRSKSRASVTSEVESNRP